MVIVSHHHEFVNQVCQEKWHVGGGKCEITGQSAAALEAQKLEWKRQEETTDAFGNTIKIKAPKKELSRKEKKAKAKANKARRERGASGCRYCSCLVCVACLGVKPIRQLGFNFTASRLQAFCLAMVLTLSIVYVFVQARRCRTTRRSGEGCRTSHHTRSGCGRGSLAAAQAKIAAACPSPASRHDAPHLIFRSLPLAF